MAAYRRVYDSRRLQSDCKNRDQLRNPTLGNRVWATFTFFHITGYPLLSHCKYTLFASPISERKGTPDYGNTSHKRLKWPLANSKFFAGTLHIDSTGGTGGGHGGEYSNWSARRQQWAGPGRSLWYRWLLCVVSPWRYARTVVEAFCDWRVYRRVCEWSSVLRALQSSPLLRRIRQTTPTIT